MLAVGTNDFNKVSITPDTHKVDGLGMLPPLDRFLAAYMALVEEVSCRGPPAS